MKNSEIYQRIDELKKMKSERLNEYKSGLQRAKPTVDAISAIDDEILKLQRRLRK